MKPLTDNNFEAEVAQGRTTVLFMAKWAGPCKFALQEFMEASKVNDVGAEFATFDVDDNPKIPHLFGLKGVPCFMTFEDGRPLASVVGNIPLESILDITRVT